MSYARMCHGQRGVVEHGGKRDEGGVELCLGVNGGRVRPLAQSEEGSEQRRGRASEGVEELVRPLLEGAEARQRRWDTRRHGGARSHV